MEQPRVERTLRLMRLMSGNAYLTVEQLSKRLDTSTRSIYRYIDTFKTCGFAVEKIDDSIYSLISMPSGYKDLQKLVYFSEEEARVLTSLIESLDETNILKSSLYKKLCAVFDTKSIKEHSGTSKNAANVQALGNAMKDRKTVILKDYSSSSSGTVRDRVVEPFEFTNNHIDIWAYDCEKKEVRLFKIARIGWVDILTIDWQHEDEHDKGYLDAFRMQGKTQTHVRLEMTLRARNLLCEEVTYFISGDNIYRLDPGARLLPFWKVSDVSSSLFVCNGLTYLFNDLQENEVGKLDPTSDEQIIEKVQKDHEDEIAQINSKHEKRLNDLDTQFRLDKELLHVQIDDKRNEPHLLQKQQNRRNHDTTGTRKTV